MFLTIFTLLLLPATLYGNEGISGYYVRYDVKSINHQIVNDNLLLVPEDDDFRVEKFSLVPVSGEISADGTGRKGYLEENIRDDALKRILTQKGLKSVKSKDLETVVSYEGAIRAPFTIIQKRYNDKKDQIFYEAEVTFAPIAFPDRWESLGMKHRLKGILRDILNLFK